MRSIRLLLGALSLASATVFAQQNTIVLGPGPWVFDTYEAGTRIEVSVVARPLSHPWSLAFLPDGGILVTERAGRLRLVRDGRLLPDPVADMPEVSNAALAGLLDLALHPQFEQNHLVYFTYSKPLGDVVATALGLPIFTAIGGATLLFLWMDASPLNDLASEAYSLASNDMMPALPT